MLIKHISINVKMGFFYLHEFQISCHMQVLCDRKTTLLNYPLWVIPRGCSLVYIVFSVILLTSIR